MDVGVFALAVDVVLVELAVDAIELVVDVTVVVVDGVEAVVVAAATDCNEHFPITPQVRTNCLRL